jgi:hypothetical protein
MIGKQPAGEFAIPSEVTVPKSSLLALFVLAVGHDSDGFLPMTRPQMGHVRWTCKEAETSV